MLNMSKKFTSNSKDTYTLVLCDQDKFEDNDPDYIIGERVSKVIPRIDESVVVDLMPYYVQGVSHDLDGNLDKVYVTIAAADGFSEEDSEA
jgi:hypothetical protein